MGKTKLTKRMRREYDAILSKNIISIQSFNWTHVFSKKMKDVGFPSYFGWAAVIFARKYKSREINLKKLQRIVILHGTAPCIFEWARDIPGANMRKLQEAIIVLDDPDSIQAFAGLPGARSHELLSLLVVLEVMKI